ncbi:MULTISPECIES: TIGR04376 family protein [unclassified Synechocystis]|uniref:TIGR04376 family protein n=1 Tax=unclassified Synechocystis TaxID=2640012 RepID=UPI000423A076|nr:MULTISPECIES: TIGR04376 family protein [unclassified Synechocystis]AIE75006.1 hypothetical protein D082_24780 [Synechocystis sp. PCC 6714]MCT0253287.1 TIGR04376 family protein [Synechocystis sp. CS-94]
MGVFDDVGRFLEDRLEEFLHNNPHLELEALLEQLKEQEADARRLLVDLERKKQDQENQILNLAQDIQAWHSRIQQAQVAGREDLAQKAQEREATLLRQGNQVWGQRAGTEQRISQAQNLLKEIQQRQKEVAQKAKQVAAQQKASEAQRRAADTMGWNQGNTGETYHRELDPLEAEFKKWEVETELDRLKRNVSR